jgi:hypothetical protein
MINNFSGKETTMKTYENPLTRGLRRFAWVMIAMGIALAVCAVILSPGCINPPKDTVYLRDGDSVIGLAHDRNGDGQPDMIPQVRPKIDADGKGVIGDDGKPAMELVIGNDGLPVMVPDIIPGSEIYRPAEKADSIGPSVLGVAGALVPGGIGAILVGLAAAWRGSRFGRIFANTVMSIQQARARLKTGGQDEALKLLDEALRSGQLQATIDEIKKIKAQMGLESVTGPKV